MAIVGFSVSVSISYSDRCIGCVSKNNRREVVVELVVVAEVVEVVLNTLLSLQVRPLATNFFTLKVKVAFLKLA